MERTKHSTVLIPDLAGKVVLVTGASTGIGAAVARAFAEQGSSVGIHYNTSAAEASALAEDIAVGGGKTFLVRGDVSVPDEMRRIVDETANHFGRLDGLVNNAGSMLGRILYADVTEEHYDAVMDLNAKSVLVACRAALPWLRKNGGFIINTSSIVARTGGGGGVGLYASSKAFVSSFTRGLAREVISSGIRVNAVSPGVIETRFHERDSTPEQLKAALATIPQGRLGAPSDCVGSFLFLASDLLSGYITGQTIEVNGGQAMP
ncbi:MULTISPECIES: SDR family NAD(P)-dependent oxidoreductase [Chelativorans]|jgi:3-oxoacyl-[acyl-carrier protein] reductase|uniref:Short-chain dehydrogenase/reductase SDR n=1 Tax=Chelativorans sp. (strain BNC1) TaxID=266779 RepID=Q11BT3_CHESB|nr:MULTISPECIES: SDR family oxidoreductase [Chelativorans]